jgi:hypothetical protein
MKNRRSTVASRKRAVNPTLVRTSDGRIVRASKQHADAVIAEAKRQLSRLDIDGIPDERLRIIVANATAYAASIRTKRTKISGRRRVDKNGNVRTAKGYVRVVVTDVRGVEQQIATFIDLLLRSLPETLRKQYETEFLNLELKPSSAASGVARALVGLSDILRAIVEPWDHDVSRRFGIACLPNSYPVTVPGLLANEMRGHLVDQREYLAIQKQTYIVKDHGGDLFKETGPASKPDGTVEPRTFLGFKGISIASLNKLRESLPPPSERDLGSAFGPAWPWPTRLAGLRNGQIYIADYLAAARFGAIPESETELLDESPEDSSEYPPLPAGRRRIK